MYAILGTSQVVRASVMQFLFSTITVSSLCSDISDTN